ncbi:IgGFc-binding protein-like [Crassostrea angulata]|uniref:IgGFc-binding protein-like n=1 Tax=Magallana angulata TaxID=2784310 RepID=UPI0022B1CF63|nr:IgGFc-binding protein-like [Crassostrea angulata]XP_052694890.1 IgGFc-binding protein-like [Crassostrea angulata]
MGRTSNDTKNVYIASKKGASMNISTSQDLDNSLKRQIDRTVSIASSQHIIFPPQLELNKFKRELKSVFIETFGDSFVVSLDNMKWYAGSLGLIPIHKLSTYYVVISTEPSSSFSSQFALAAIKNNTSVSITFKMKQNIPLYIHGNSFLNGDAYTLTLDRFETYQIAHGTDLTGTVVQSSKPIAVFSGNDCNWLENIGYCDPLIEQVIPTAKLDNMYIVPPNPNDRNTKVLITAVDQSNISYTVDQTSHTVSLNKLDSFDIIISSRQTCVIESNTTIIVTSFGLSSQISDMGDPSMTNVPGVHQYIDYYKTIVPYGFNYSYVTVIMKQSLKDSIRINNTAINRNNVVFEENVSAMKLSYNVRSIQVEAGEVIVSTVGGEKFGLMFSGVKAWAAYGFSAFNL